MNTETLIDAIGGIDAAYVEEAELWQKKSVQKKSRGYFRMLAAAACLMVVMAGAFAVLKKMDLEGPQSGAGGNMAEGGYESGEEINAGGTVENEGQEMTNGEAGESAGENLFEIPEEVTEVTVTCWKNGTESTFTVEGTALADLREWTKSLVLGEAISFADGQVPGENGSQNSGEVFSFRFGEQEFSYYNYGKCYLVAEDIWYPVLNPEDPPVSRPAD